MFLCNTSAKNYFYIITIGVLLLPFLDRYFHTHIAPKDLYTLGLYWLACVAIIFVLSQLGILKK